MASSRPDPPAARGQRRRFAAMLVLAAISGVLLAVTHAPFWAVFIPVGLLCSFGTAYVMLGGPHRG